MGIEMLIQLAAEMCPDRVAFGPRSGEVTFAKFNAQCTRVAGNITRYNRGGVAFIGHNGSEFATAVFGSAMAGVPITPLNYRLPALELERQVESLGDTLLIIGSGVDPPALSTSITAKTASEILADSGEAPSAGGSPSADSSPAVVLFTSGTTSKPKRVPLSHANLLAYVLQSLEPASASPDDCALVAVPPYHIAGVAAVLTNTYCARRVIHLPRFDARVWLDLAQRENVTSAMVVPTMLARIVDAATEDGRVPPPVGSIAYGGSRIPQPVLERALELFPATDFTNAYGLTETSSTIAMLTPEDHRTALADESRRIRLMSVGRPIPGIEIAVRDEQGRDLAPGHAGELWVRGHQVSKAYADDVSATRPDGWFDTHDRAWIDADGYIFLEGRSDDVIIRGGENVSPAEIEDALLRHPDVTDVGVVGIPNEEWGESIAAAVVLRKGSPLSMTELRHWARTQLRTAKTPDVILAVPELPYTSSGKLIRRELSRELRDSVNSARPSHPTMEKREDEKGS
jgi:acyl-CoA synthetase (AMP-forming)/AMP-acid ligase II